MNARRLSVGDEDVVIALAEQTPLTRAQADGVRLRLRAAPPPRRSDNPFVYEVGVREPYRRRGVATRLLRELESLARRRGVRRAFVLTAESNEAAMRLYQSVGGVRPFDDDVMWRFEFADD